MKPHYVYVVKLNEGYYRSGREPVAHMMDARHFKKELPALRVAVQSGGIVKKMVVLEDRILDVSAFSQQSLDLVMKREPVQN